jgi:hypothetical protein
LGTLPQASIRCCFGQYLESMMHEHRPGDVVYASIFAACATLTTLL